VFVRLGQTVHLDEGQPYVLERLLGRGGMGEVYLATRPGAGGIVERLAVKVVRTRALLGRGVAHFLDEARLHQLLQHPKIVQAHSVHVEGGTYFLAMDYLDGRSLRSLLDLTASKGLVLEEATACHLIAEVAEALDYVHRATDEQGRPLRIVHRDVSPSNIFICASGEVKLLDFGVAKSQLEGRLETGSSEEAYQGKLTYLSPEQANRQPLDGRSDLFSLGIVFVEALLGAKLFDVGTDVLVLDVIRNVSPEYVESIIGSLPDALKAILHRMLTRQPGDRFSTCQEVADALRMYARARSYRTDAKGVAAEVAALEALDIPPPASPRHQEEPPQRSFRRLFLLGAAMVLAIAAAAGLWYRSTHQEQRGQAPTQNRSPMPLPIPNQVPMSEPIKPSASPPPHAKKKSATARACAGAGMLGLLAASAGCPVHVVTHAKAGDCTGVALPKEVDGRPIPDNFNVAFVSLNGQHCAKTDEIGTGLEPCPVGEGAIELHEQGIYSAYPQLQAPFRHAFFHGHAHVVEGKETIDEEKVGRRNVIGRMVAQLTEMQLEDGRKIPVCGVLFDDVDDGKAEQEGKVDKEGIPVLDPSYYQVPAGRTMYGGHVILYWP
jgi:serine/threonine protein kinase